MRIYELVAVLNSFPDDRAEVLVKVQGNYLPIGYVVRTLEGRVLIGSHPAHTSLAGDAPPVLDS